MVLSSGSLSLMFVVDRIFLTWYSRDALAAAMPAGLLYWSIAGMLVGTVMYVNTFVAQYEGAEQAGRVVSSVWQGLYLSVIGGLFMLLFIPFADEIFSVIGHAESVQQLESEYFAILCLGGLPSLLSTALFSFYSGRGKTLTVMYVNFGVSLMNILLDYLLIFGIGPFPKLGIQGAAIATVAAQVYGLIAYIALFVRDHRQSEYPTLAQRKFDRPLFGRLVRYGLPTGLQYLSDIAGFALFIFLIGQIGRNELAATNLAFNLNSMAFVPMFGFGTAVMTLVGKRIGEQRPELAIRTTWLAFRVCSVYMLAFIALFVFLPDVILAPYAVKSAPEEFEPLRNLAINLLRFVAIYSFFDGMAIVFGAAIRGAGDTRFSLIFTFFAAWIFMVLPTFVIWKWFDKNLFAAWAACSVYVVILGIGFLIRFRMGQWRSMRVIESADELQQMTVQNEMPNDDVQQPEMQPQDVTTIPSSFDGPHVGTPISPRPQPTILPQAVENPAILSPGNSNDESP
ncbi:MAG: MATE family efflux transporter [Planctomycetaceae bacterium]